MTEPFDDPTLALRYGGKVALVTGAAGVIGRAVALRLADEEATVWCVDVVEEGVAETVALIEAAGANARGGRLDVTDDAACRATVAAVVDELGGVDVLCNIAGIGGSAHTVEETAARFDAMFQVNAAGPFHLIQSALPSLLERGGNIVNLASTAGVIGQAYCAAYCASKHALVGLTKAVALEYGRQGIRCNAVCPGQVDTGIIASFMPPEGASGSLIARQFLTRDSQGPDSVASMVAYLGSPEAWYVNGAVLTIDGGTTAG